MLLFFTDEANNDVPVYLQLVMQTERKLLKKNIGGKEGRAGSLLFVFIFFCSWSNAFWPLFLVLARCSALPFWVVQRTPLASRRSVLPSCCMCSVESKVHGNVL